MNREDEPLSRVHIRLFSSDVELLQRALPPGQFSDYVRDIVANHVAANRAWFVAKASLPHY